MSLKPARISAMLRAAGLPGTVVQMKPCRGGKSSTVYRVEMSMPPSPVALRVYARDPASCAVETAVLRRVCDDVMVPSVLYAEPDVPSGPPWSVQGWLEGERMEDWLPNADARVVVEVMRSAGAVAARIHAHSLAEPGFLAPDLSVARPFGDLVDFFLAATHSWLYGAVVSRRLGAGLRDDVWNLLDTNRALLDGARLARSLVHSDYKPANLLVAHKDGAWRIVGVLDWEFAHSGTGLMDAAILLRHERQLPDGCARAFADGYRRAGGVLSANWRRQALLLDLVNLCCMLDLPSDRPVACAGMVACVTDTLRRWPSVEEC